MSNSGLVIVTGPGHINDLSPMLAFAFVIWFCYNVKD